MSLDRIEHARRILADAGDLLTADPMKLYWVARQVQPLLDLLDGAGYSRKPDNGDPSAVLPAGVLGLGRARGGNWIEVPLKPCCGLLAGDVCGCAANQAEAVAAFLFPLKIGRSQ